MKQLDRSDHIAAILETIGPKYSAGKMASLEAYIADLEAKQPDRPAQIAAMLEAIGSDFPAEMRVSLEAYISDLESNQMAVPPGKGAPAHDTAWLYWQTVKSERRHRARALRKQNNYQ